MLPLRILTVGLTFAGLRAAAAPFATCGESRLELTAPPGSSGELRALVVSPDAGRWRYASAVALARMGGRTRTVTVENLRTEEGRPRRDDTRNVAPSQLFIDLFLDEDTVTLRHASEGGDDPEYHLDLHGCRFPPEGDAALAALVPAPREPTGCAPATVRATYLPQVAKADPGDGERDALALCESHQKTAAARARLEQAIADRAARLRKGARGLALLRSEEERLKVARRVDGCLRKSAGAEAHPMPVAKLHEEEASERACYERITAKLANH